VVRAPELDAGLQVGSHQSRGDGQNPLPQPTGHTTLDSSPITGRVRAGATKSCLFKNPVTSESPELADAACAAWTACQGLRTGVPKYRLIHVCCAPALLFRHTSQHPLIQPTII